MSTTNILEKLKTIFEGKFGDILSNNKFTLFDFSKKSKDVIEVKDDKTLVIDFSRLKPEQQKLIKEQILDKSILEDNEVFLMDKSRINTERIKRNLPPKDDELLNFYKDKLSPTLYKVLEAALVVRNVHNNKEDIKELKRGIAVKYPDIGNNMCNLVTRGYFDGHFKELYESMFAEEDFDINVYQEKVKNIVKSLPYIVFVDQYKTYEENSEEVRFKLEKLRKYGTGKLVLHALSKGNVETTLKIIDEYKDDKSIRIEIDMNPTRTIITATLIF